MNTTILGFVSVILGGIAMTPLLVETDHAPPPAFEALAAARVACAAGIGRPGPTHRRTQEPMPDCVPAVGVRVAVAR